MAEGLRLIPGENYIYTGRSPEKCTGHLYHFVRRIQQVPSYQWNVLVLALTGPDTGLLFCCTEWNFTTRYRLASEEDYPRLGLASDVKPDWSKVFA